MGRATRRFAVAAFAAVAGIAVLVVAVPFVVTLVPLPEVVFDASPWLKGKAASLVASSNVTARLSVSRGDGGGFLVCAKGMLLDWPFTARANVRFGFLRASGDLALSLDETDWRLVADFEARSGKNWRFAAYVPESKFSSGDAVFGRMLRRLGPLAVSNLVCSGSFTLSADGECRPGRPVPAWSASGSVDGVDASFDAGGKPVSVGNLRLRFGARGLADRREVFPLFPKADRVEAAGVLLTNVFASVRAADGSYLVTEAGAECAGGELRTYSFFLNPKRLSAGATIYVEGVDAGKVLAHVSGFRGEATGRLHGKLPFYLRNGRELRFRNSYLFSTPGETGNVRVADPGPILDSLAAGGVSEEVRGNLSKALANLDYTVLRVELRRGEAGEDSSLRLKLVGSAAQGKTKVPVNLDVTFRGDLDQILDTGMKLSGR
ncbi:MAG: YdbH domain-containing protein [Kiritimatiellae bacterium]|nr:YdbH domain-containing protein [Kiritimatiellia bacterium]